MAIQSQLNIFCWIVLHVGWPYEEYHLLFDQHNITKVQWIQLVISAEENSICSFDRVLPLS